MNDKDKHETEQFIIKLIIINEIIKNVFIKKHTANDYKVMKIIFIQFKILELRYKIIIFNIYFPQIDNC